MTLPECLHLSIPSSRLRGTSECLDLRQIPSRIASRHLRGTIRLSGIQGNMPGLQIYREIPIRLTILPDAVSPLPYRHQLIIPSLLHRIQSARADVQSVIPWNNRYLLPQARPQRRLPPFCQNRQSGRCHRSRLARSFLKQKPSALRKTPTWTLIPTFSRVPRGSLSRS